MEGSREPLPGNPSQQELAALYGKDERYPWEVKDPDSIFYSRWNTDVEGCYLEIEDVRKVHSVIESCLEKLNDSNERMRIDVFLYNQLNKHMIKVLRVLSTSNGHLINVAMKGFGMTSVVNLVSFAAGHSFHTFETY